MLLRKPSCPVCVKLSQSDCRMEAANAHTNCMMSKPRLEMLEFNPLKATMQPWLHGIFKIK